MSESPDKVEALFDAVIQVAPAERMAYLARVCGDDEQLRHRVERLLSNLERAGNFLSQNDEILPGSTRGVALMVEKPGDRIERYKLLERIGEGGCGVVYMAEQQEPVHRRVALKILKLGMDTRSVIARFEAERQALALMDHPNIARVLDAGATETGRPYFVMELVGGIKITDYCEKKNLSIRRRLDLFIEVCRAIQHAHQKGVIHRDIKPSNVLVAEQDGSAVPKVIDFGIAKATQGKLTEQTVFTAFEQFLGTPAYMSPEQAQPGGLDVDTRSDIYSLGVLLYELLTGKTPFDAKELMAVGLEAMRRTIREKEPPTPSTRLKQDLAAQDARSDEAKIQNPKSKIANDLDWIVMKCLEKERARRYETANGLATDIQRHLNNEPVAAGPPSKLYRLQKLARRNRAVFAAAGGILLALASGVVFSSWQAVRARRAELEQRRLRYEAVTAQANESNQKAQAQQRLYESLLGESRATRSARHVGYRDRVYQLLQQANALNLPQMDPSQLRQEAVACMGDFVGLTPGTFTNVPSDTTIFRACLDPAGKLAAFTLKDGRILLCELPSGKEVAQLKTEVPATDVCFSVQGNQLISINYLPRPLPTEVRVRASRICVWEAGEDTRWKQVAEIPLPGAWECFPCARGVLVIVFSYQPRQGRVFDLKTRTIIQSFDFPTWGVEWGIPCATISRDGRLLATENQSAPGLHDHEIDISDLSTGKLLKRLEPRMGDLSSLTFSSDGSELCCLSDYEGGVIYRTSDFKPITEFSGAFLYRSRPSFAQASAIVALPLGQRQSGIRLWDLTARKDLATLDEPEPAIEAMFANDQRFLMTYGNGSARFYWLDRTPEKVTLSGHAGLVAGMVFSPDGIRLASVGTDRKLRVWDCADGRQRWVSENLPGSGQSVACSPDGQYLAAGDADTKWISVWDANTGKPLSGLGTNTVGWNWSTQFSPDGRYFLTAGGGYEYNEGIDLWTIQSNGTGDPQGNLRANLSRHLSINSCSLVIAPDSRHVAFVDNPGEHNPIKLVGYHLYIWDLASNGAPRVVANDFVPAGQSESFTPDSKRLIYTSSNREVVTLDVATGSELSRFRTLDPGQLRNSSDFPNLTLSPDGTRLAMISVSSLGVDLWDPVSGKLIFSLPEQSNAVCWLTWAPDSRRLAVARSDGSIAIWNLTQIDRNLAKLGLSSRP
jgi:serine/threonine protein kinase/WD40 repeat protein